MKNIQWKEVGNLPWILADVRFCFFSLAPFSANVSGSDCFTGQSPGTRRTRRAKVQGPLSYHEMLHAELGHEPQSLFELESLCCRASAQENKAATKRPGQRVIYDDVFHALLAERRKTRSKSQRAKLSKFIRKHLRRALREHRNGRTEHVLDDEFKDLDRLPHYARAPVHPCSTTGGEECPGPDEFATFLENIFASEIGFESPHLITVVQEIEATGFRETSHHGKRRKCTETLRAKQMCWHIVAECFVYESLELHKHLLRLFTWMLVDGDVEEKWKQTTLSMTPRTGDPTSQSVSQSGLYASRRALSGRRR